MAAEILTQPAPLPPPEVIRKTAEEILQRPDYSLQPGADLSFIKRFIESIIKAWKHAFDSLYAVSPLLAWTTFILLSLLALGLMLHVLYTIRMALQGRRRVLTIGEIEEEVPEQPAVWEQKAQQAAAQADYIVAVRCLLRAGLLRLETAQKKTVQRGRTNREYLRRFRDTPAFEPLRSLVEVVDHKWYGGGACTPEDYRAGTQAYAQIQQAAGALAAPRNEAAHAHGA